MGRGGHLPLLSSAGDTVVHASGVCCYEFELVLVVLQFSQSHGAAQFRSAEMHFDLVFRYMADIGMFGKTREPSNYIVWSEAGSAVPT